MNRRTFAARAIGAVAGLVAVFRAKPAAACIDTDYQAYMARLANCPAWLQRPSWYEVGMNPERKRLAKLPSIADVVGVRLVEVTNSKDMIVMLDCIDGTSISVSCVGNVRHAVDAETHNITGRTYPVYSLDADKI